MARKKPIVLFNTILRFRYSGRARNLKNRKHAWRAERQTYSDGHKERRLDKSQSRGGDPDDGGGIELKKISDRQDRPERRGATSAYKIV